ncbi:ATPase, histidine kinase-, DNA gyrase B-, and HSP90-like domain protein [Synechococcus sp. PCC 7335]|uniref:sensor histidine kinase n=1 Tax=Synechococcus sp. (strain ATCC 29403 / PCC 7335) TaxID=91464 RepID=UPI00017EB813|nr:ATP-binding protein [Synechococcus sp. PCC 7335]EDX86318.1 ATPase, histidine kinase-, DNA gyrase B-, and HSP90-like domain protein [Synechococcus sp. PCC 7335]
MSLSSHQSRPAIESLEKENRILRRKLGRAEATILQLEETTRKKEALLRQVINEFKESQTFLEQQSYELEQTCINLKFAQAQLIQAEKMSALGQLVAGVAHEINNPVNFIYGNLSHLEDYIHSLLSFLKLYEARYPNPDANIRQQGEEMDIAFIKEDAQNILSSMTIGTERIREIVLSLRNFSRMDEAECKFVDIHEGIESTLQILQHRLKAQSNRAEIKIVRDFGDLPLVECFAGQLNQVVMNIIANAIDAIETSLHNNSLDREELQIMLQTKASADSVVISIADNGTGMPLTVRERIFEPFFTTKPVGKGTGMGMAISYQIIVEKHSGKIECFSDQGVGTKFVITIPIQLAD